MSNIDKTPEFFVIGAQKAGTTTLHDRLIKCDQVNLPITKETHFFSDDDNFARGLSWYYKQFTESRNFTKRGEVAPDYLFSETAPARIKLLTADPKIICLFRNPLERAFSNYLMAVRNGYEDLNFHDALLAEKERTIASSPRKRTLYSYIGRSLYGAQLSRYLEILPEARYLFLKFEDFIDKGVLGMETYRCICEFLGVPQCASNVDFSAKSNVASSPRSAFLRNQLYNPSLLKRILRLVIPSHDIRARIAYRIDKFNQRPINKSPIGKVPEQVIAQLLDDMLILESISGLDLTSWKDGISSHNRGK